MKCPMCLGKGYATDEDIKEYPHRCQNCNGKGFYSVDWQKVRCEVCNGSGKKPMTNEEWLKSLSTEELANYIATQCADAIRLWREMQYWTAHEKCKSNKWYVWLKEVHNADRS